MFYRNNNQFHKKYGDADIKDAIEEVIAIVEDIPYSNGLQFSVKVNFEFMHQYSVHDDVNEFVLGSYEK